MSLELSGLQTVLYPAPNLAAATAWWTTILGKPPYFQQPYYVGFQIGGYELGLVPDANPADGCIVYWGVSDVQAAVDELVVAGGSVVSEPTNVGDGIITASVRTPSGGVLGLIYNPHFAVSP